MSRQSDIKALRELRGMLSETKSFIDMSEAELEKYKECEKELTGTKFVFQPLPTDHEAKATAKFRNAWVDKFSDPEPMRKRVRVVFTIILALFVVLAIVDMVTASGFLFTNVAEVKEINSIIGASVLAYAMLGVFFVSGILFTWCFFSESYSGVRTIIIIAFAILGLILYSFGDSMGGNKPILIYIIGVALSMLSNAVVNVIYSIKEKHPRLNAEQKAIVAQEKQKDDDNAVKNVEKEEKDRAEWQAWWDVHKYEIDAEMDVHMDMAKAAIAKAEELHAKVENSDVLGPKEKDEGIIDWLLYFLEGHRADSIKEALQQFDLMQHNEKMLEIEREKYNLEVARIQKENADRERALEQQRYHQMRMEAEARRAADMQSQVAANTAAMRDSAEKLRRDAAWNASQVTAAQDRIANELSFQRMQDYYNN